MAEKERVAAQNLFVECDDHPSWQRRVSPRARTNAAHLFKLNVIFFRAKRNDDGIQQIMLCKLFS